jgi:hypothetical protein
MRCQLRDAARIHVGLSAFKPPVIPVAYRGAVTHAKSVETMMSDWKLSSSLFTYESLESAK